MKPRLLITGALGHIGSALIRTIRPEDAAEVVLLDNLSTQRYCSLFELPAGVPFTFVEADVTKDDLGQYFEGIHAVVHLAAITTASTSFAIQEEIERVNAEGTRRVAEACRARQNRLLFVSSSSVYASTAAVIDEETPDAVRPQTPYAASKISGEQTLEALGRDGLRYNILRFGTICGVSAGMRFHTAINKFCWQASLGRPISVWKTALDQRRPYLDLDDAVEAIRFVLGRDLFDNRVYNVLTDNTTVRQIIEMIRGEIPDVRIELVESPAMNDLSYDVSVDRFTKAGFTFRGDLGACIRRTLALLGGIRRPQVAPASGDRAARC